VNEEPRRIEHEGDEPHPGPRDVVSRRQALVAGAAGSAWLLALGHGGTAFAAETSTTHGEEAPMTTARFLAVLRAERAQWDALLAEVGPERMTVPGVEGEWSVKEIVGHLTWYERVVVDGARRIMRTGTYGRTGLARLPIDARNERLAAESRARSTEDVLGESRRVHDDLLSTLQAVPDEQLNNPDRFGLPAGVPPWRLVAANTYEHYRGHGESIRAWLHETA
jgi:hypothetical protein